jgi:hypothetical protein
MDWHFGARLAITRSLPEAVKVVCRRGMLSPTVDLSAKGFPSYKFQFAVLSRRGSGMFSAVALHRKTTFVLALLPSSAEKSAPAG